MILNGKAKDNFIDYIDSDDLLVEGMSDIHRNALIIEFFDEQNIYIDIRIEFNDSFVLKTFDSYVDSDYVGNYSSRLEATIQAITKANKIYNERFK